MVVPANTGLCATFCHQTLLCDVLVPFHSYPRELCIDAESPAANLQALVGIMGLPSLQKLTLVLSCKAQGWVEFSRAMALRPKLKVMLDIEGFPWRLEPLKCLSDLTIHLYKVEQAAWTKGIPAVARSSTVKSATSHAMAG